MCELMRVHVRGFRIHDSGEIAGDVADGDGF